MPMTLEEHLIRLKETAKTAVIHNFSTSCEKGTAANAIHTAYLWHLCLEDEMQNCFNILLGGGELDGKGEILFDEITTDHYDNSVELKGVKVGTQIPDALAKTIYEMGFDRFWVCFADGTEEAFAKGG